MNIAFVLSYLEDRFGGPITAVKKLGGVLADRGHEVSYWATGDGHEEGSVTKGLVRVYPYGWPSSWRRSKGLVQGLSEAVHSIDIMHVSELWLHSTYAASRVAVAYGVPYILRPAGCLEPWRLKNGYWKSLKKRLYIELLGRTVIDNAACLQAVSMQEADGFRLAGHHNPVAVVPNGVDKDLFDDGDKGEADAYWPQLKGRPVVLFMSRLSPEKGLDLLIPLWADLVKRPSYRDAILVIAGPDYRGYEKAVNKMIRRYNLASHTLVTGMIQGHRKHALLWRSDIFVLPSYSENFGIVVAEALACGTPVVTTTRTPWQQIHEINAGRWVSPDKTSLAVAVQELLDLSESQRREMGQRGRAMVEREYSWDMIGHKFVTLCDCILKGQSVEQCAWPFTSTSLAE